MRNIKKLFVTIMTVSMIFLSTKVSAFAIEPEPQAKLINDNTITFSNLDNVRTNEVVEFNVMDSQGNPATISIQRMPSVTKASSRDWKVSYTGLVVNAHFYMTVSGNKVTNIYDEWILTIGGTFSDDSFTSTSAYGKLSFTVSTYADIISAKCWLKGTVTGSDNDINVTWQM